MFALLLFVFLLNHILSSRPLSILIIPFALYWLTTCVLYVLDRNEMDEKN
jgi:hypothetical protein